MDPLSIASAVVGLLTATGKVYSLLEGLSAIRNAPVTIKDAQKEVRHAETALRLMQRLLERLDASNSRRQLIQVDELRITLADAMLAFSAFEAMLQRLAGLARVRVAISWPKFSKQMDEHVARIGRYQQSLMLMLSILQCDSDAEAYQSQEKLQSLVERVLEENTELRQKLVDSEDTFAARSIATRQPEDENATIRLRGNDDASTIRGIGRTQSVRSTISNFGGGMIKFAFENILEQSRAYRRNANQLECDRSFASTAQRSHAWSVFCGYSLADISVMSVIAMPLSTLDISNGKHYVIHPENESSGTGNGTDQPGDIIIHISTNSELESKVTSTNSEPPEAVQPEDGLREAARQDIPVDRSASGSPVPEATTIGDPIHDEEWDEATVEALNINTPLTSLGSSSTSLLSGLDSASRVSPHSLASDNVPILDNNTESVSDHEHDIDLADLNLSDGERSFDDNPPCAHCGEILEEGKAFELAGKHWHVDCFRCSTCDILLDSDANLLLLGDGSLVCNNCTYDCDACGNKIEDLAILTDGKSFCAPCFRCRNCKRKIENLRYAKTSQGMFCMDCHGAMMAQVRGRMEANKTIPPILEEDSNWLEEGDDAEGLTLAGPSGTEDEWVSPLTPLAERLRGPPLNWI